jgi:pyrimidine operon attenuation protein/uracil phosphoribosyltransferase
VSEGPNARGPGRQQATTAPGFAVRREILSAPQLQRVLSRLARAIAGGGRGEGGLVLVGVQTRGVPLARRLARLIEAAGGDAPPVGALDITLYRDDLSTVAEQPVIRGTDIPVSIDGRTVVLVDDVLFTGRTVRAALDELIDFGRPARIELAVLVDRGHRELPIRADHVGRSLATARDEAVQVLLSEQDGEDRVLLLGRADARPAKAARSTAARGRTTAKARGGRR